MLDWHRAFAAGDDAVMIARRTRDVAELNERARELLRRRGRGGAERARVGGEPFAVGDRSSPASTRRRSPTASAGRWSASTPPSSACDLAPRRRAKGATLDPTTWTSAPLAASRRSSTPTRSPPTRPSRRPSTRPSPCSTPAISREDFLVAISRARGATTAYGVAASELTDPELGPGTREIEDAAHELRAGAERAAGRVRGGRGRRRASGSRRCAARPRRAPGRAGASSAAAEPSAPPPRSDSPTSSGGSTAAESRLARSRWRARHRRCAARRRQLAVSKASATASQSRWATAAAAAGLSRIRAGRAGLDRGPPRSSCAAARSRSSARGRRKLIEESLGERPKDPLQAALWNEGVELIYGYRQRYGITSSRQRTRSAREPRDVAQRRERREAELRLARVQTAARQAAHPQCRARRCASHD